MWFWKIWPPTLDSRFTVYNVFNFATFCFVRLYPISFSILLVLIRPIIWISTISELSLFTNGWLRTLNIYHNDFWIFSCWVRNIRWFISFTIWQSYSVYRELLFTLLHITVLNGCNITIRIHASVNLLSGIIETNERIYFNNGAVVTPTTSSYR